MFHSEILAAEHKILSNLQKQNINLVFFRTASLGRWHRRTVPAYPVRVHKYYTTWQISGMLESIIMLPLCLQELSWWNSYLFSEISVCYTSVFLLTYQSGNSYINLMALSPTKSCVPHLFFWKLCLISIY